MSNLKVPTTQCEARNPNFGGRCQRQTDNPNSLCQYHQDYIAPFEPEAVIAYGATDVVSAITGECNFVDCEAVIGIPITVWDEACTEYELVTAQFHDAELLYCRDAHRPKVNHCSAIHVYGDLFHVTVDTKAVKS